MKPTTIILLALIFDLAISSRLANSFNAGEGKSNNLTTESDFEISPNGLGKSSLSRGKCNNLRCSFEEINSCKNKCPQLNSGCLYVCFKENCNAMNCDCNTKQMRECEKICEKRAFCLQSCISSTC